MVEKIGVKSNNIELTTYIKGNKNSDYILVTLHGGPGKGSEYLQEAEAFKILEKDYLVIYFDQRGTDSSPYDLNLGLRKDTLIDDIKNVILSVTKEYSDKKIILSGVSFGGCLGFLFMSKYENLVSGYISACPAICFSKEDLEKRTNGIVQMYLKDKQEFSIYLERYNSSILGLFEDSEVSRLLIANENIKKSFKHIIAMSSWFLTITFNEIMKNINKPVLIMQGRDDKICNEKVILNGVNKVSNKMISYVSFENCGHNIFTDAQASYIENIKEFCAKIK